MDRVRLQDLYKILKDDSIMSDIIPKNDPYYLEMLSRKVE